MNMLVRSFLGAGAGLAAIALSVVAAGPARSDDGGAWNLPGPAPHLITHYMPWFASPADAGGNGDGWQHWNWEAEQARHDPNQKLADGRRDIASVYYPLIGPYSSTDRAVIRYHLATMKAAGIQGLFIDWQTPGSAMDKPIPAILDEAQKLGLKVAICYEEKTDFVWPEVRHPRSRADIVANTVSDLKYILSNYAHRPAYMTRNGSPVLFQFNGSGTGKFGDNYFTPAEWDQIMAQLPEKFVFGRQGLEPEYSSSAQFRFIWCVFRPEQADQFAAAARRMVDAGQAQFFMNSICPGFDDTGVWGWGGGPRVTPRRGTAALMETFQHALSGKPEIVQIVTWNDFNEGTVIEPTRDFGFQYLDAIATWYAQVTGRTADLASIRRPFLEYAKSCTSAQRANLPQGSLDPYLAPRPLDAGAFGVAVAH